MKQKVWLVRIFDDCLCFSAHSQLCSHCCFADKLEETLKKKDLDLAEAQKAALEKTKLAEEKLASVDKLEDENAKLKAALDAANKEVSRLKNDKIVLSDKASQLAGKRNDLEIYLGGLAKKLFLMLEGNLFYPTVLLSPAHHMIVILSLSCVFRILPKL